MVVVVLAIVVTVILLPPMISWAKVFKLSSVEQIMRRTNGRIWDQRINLKDPDPWNVVPSKITRYRWDPVAVSELLRQHLRPILCQNPATLPFPDFTEIIRNHHPVMVVAVSTGIFLADPAFEVYPIVLQIVLEMLEMVGQVHFLSELLSNSLQYSLYLNRGSCHWRKNVIGS